MTFSVLGWCPVTNQFGVAVTTSSIAVGARCPHARAGVGAVSTQNITDPRLAPAILDIMARGASPDEAIGAIVDGCPHADYRQLAVIGADGQSAVHSGAKTLGTHATAARARCVAAGNLLSGEHVMDAIADGFMANKDTYLADHLIAGLEAGLQAGGEEGPVHSAALLVVEQHDFPLIDLRVDWSDGDPVQELARLWADYTPHMRDYETRALNPSAAPSYGVPGDL